MTDTTQAATHTPGPWHPGCIVNESSSCDCRSVLDDGRYFGGIGQVFVDNGIRGIESGENDCPPKEEARANLLLFCAAPDMLAALKEFVARVDAGEIRSKKTYAAFKAIIAKAEPQAQGEG